MTYECVEVCRYRLLCADDLAVGAFTVDGLHVKRKVELEEDGGNRL
jgi:hypothetical protein